MTKKLRQKCKYLEKEKSFEDEIKKHFSSFLKGFHWIDKKIFFLEGESLALM